MEQSTGNDGSKLEERVIRIQRVSKKTSGGNYVTFSVLAAVGDKKGRIGVGLGRSTEVPQAIKKAVTQAKKKMFTVPFYKTTIPHELRFKYKAARIVLKPAPEGTGLKVGGVLRIILNLVGIQDASGKLLGSRNKTVNSYALIKALQSFKARK